MAEAVGGGKHVPFPSPYFSLPLTSPPLPVPTYRRVYGFGHLRADCRGLGSAPEPYTRFFSLTHVYFPLLLSPIPLVPSLLFLSLPSPLVQVGAW